MTRPEWASVSARIVAWWPASDLTVESLAMWYGELEFCQTEDVVAGLRRELRRGGTFAPSLAALLLAVRRVRTGPMTRSEHAVTAAFAARAELAGRPELPSGPA